MQKWEYLMVVRNRRWDSDDAFLHKASDWSTYLVTRAEENKWEGKLIDLLAILGDDGWELAATWPRSDFLGGANLIRGNIETPNFSNQTHGSITGTTTDYAGFSTSEVWIFKRSNSA